MIIIVPASSQEWALKSFLKLSLAGYWLSLSVCSSYSKTCLPKVYHRPKLHFRFVPLTKDAFFDSFNF